ncbi:hypothetical protein M2119_001558 [Aurantimicrobium minutum]|uniref:DUF6036 family nucleotidyltransferase n=1 Tax=Aurantimicrobium minutum TaxID=708131 RepID=UPI002476F787|nr:DUF6036 family nucleotidyltransferase [Aurantimicrobium minutum]MDH6533321.1 hypothetical protein [Aurantimicrobium minutum]
METVLTREDIIRGLRQLIQQAEEHGINSQISIVGGAALTLSYFDRDVTVDIDARATQWNLLKPIVERIAEENGWVSNWFNVDAAQFVPSLGKNAEWVILYKSDTVTISVATAEVLLMMKLAAARRGRDYGDAEKLMATTGLTDREVIEELFEEYFPGDVLPRKASIMLDQIFQTGISEPPVPPQAPLLD